MTELTRNESADLFERIVGNLMARVPASTRGIRTFGVDAFLDTAGSDALHQDHRDWLAERLNKETVLDEIDKFAATMRAAGSPAPEAWWD